MSDESPGNVNWRFRVPDGAAVEFEDINLGPQRFVAGEDFGDFVVWRRDGTPGGDGGWQPMNGCAATPGGELEGNVR